MSDEQKPDYEWRFANSPEQFLNWPVMPRPKVPLEVPPIISEAWDFFKLSQNEIDLSYHPGSASPGPSSSLWPVYNPSSSAGNRMIAMPPTPSRWIDPEQES